MIQLRSYRSTDLEAMYALDVVCFEKPFRFSRRAMRQFAEAENACVVIAEAQGMLAGFVIAEMERTGEVGIAYLVTLDVDPSHRRRGIAIQLVREIERRAIAKKMVALLLHVFEENVVAIRFYESIGFSRSQRVENFYGGGLGAWVYQKFLTALD